MTSTVILSDNGASSGSAGLKSQGGNDGVLILQTTTSGGTATNAIYVDTSQNVGLGATPSAWGGSGAKALQLGARASVFTVSGGATLGQNYYFDGGNDKYIQNGYTNRFVLDPIAGNVQLQAAASGTAGNNITWSTILSGNKDVSIALQGASSSAGTGISFPATQSASSDANTLDDYEEGVWTPVVTDNGTDRGATYSYRSGRYVKIGNTVWISFGLKLSGVGTGGTANVIYITGLPFTAVSYGAYQEPAVSGQAGNLVTAANAYKVKFLPETGGARLFTRLSDGGDTSWVYTDLTSSTFMSCQISYTVA